MAIHDIVATTYYLENYDRSKINLEVMIIPSEVCKSTNPPSKSSKDIFQALVVQDCHLNDDALKVFGSRLWRVKKVQLTGNNFTQKGLHDLTRRLGDVEDKKIVTTLDLSDCQLDDEALGRYGIKKLSGVHRRTKALKKLDMSRCQLSQNGFYELIPIILKSEHVILQVEKVRDGNYQTFLSQGNQITPLELKIFSGQLREVKGAPVLKILDLSSSNLNDEALYQISKLAFLIENVDLHNSHFGEEGITMLTKCFYKFEGGVLKTLNLRMCKLTEKCLDLLAPVVPHLTSAVLSSNNFSGAAALKTLAAEIDKAEDRKLKHIDLRHSRIPEAGKKVMNEVCRKHKIDLKIW